MDIGSRVKELGFPIGSYAVFGSGPLAVRKIREAHDIDIIVTPEFFKKLAADPTWKSIQLVDKHTGLQRDDVQIFQAWAPGSWDVTSLIKDADVIDDVPYVELRSVLEWKQLRDKPKDKHDIELIEQYLKHHQ